MTQDIRIKQVSNNKRLTSSESNERCQQWVLQQCREGTGSRQSKTVSGAENLSCSRGSVSETTLSRFFSDPFKAGAVPFLLCKKSPYLEIPNEEHQPFAIAPHCSQNVVQGPVAINLEPECRISGPTPHLRNPMLQLNKIPGKLYTHWRARGAGLINLPPSVPQDLCRQTQRLFCWSHVSTLSLSGVSILVLSWFPDEESGKRAPRGFPRLPRKWAPLLGPEPLLLEWFICWWVIQSDHNRLTEDYQNVHLTREENKTKERKKLRNVRLVWLCFTYNMDLHLKNPKPLSGMRWSLGVKNLINLNQENGCNISTITFKLAW